MTLALLLELEELSRFTGLAKLERLVLPIKPRIVSFPNM